MCNPVYTEYACGHTRSRGIRSCGYYRRHGTCFYADQAQDIYESSRRICNYCLAESALSGYQYASGR